MTQEKEVHFALKAFYVLQYLVFPVAEVVGCLLSATGISIYQVMEDLPDNNNISRAFWQAVFAAGNNPTPSAVLK